MDKETLFGYGFLLVGCGVPYLVDKLFGPFSAFLFAALCTFVGVVFLIAAHRHDKRTVRPHSRGLMPTIAIFALTGAIVGALIGTMWFYLQKHNETKAGNLPPEGTPQAVSPKQDEKPPTLSDLFNKDFPNTMKAADDALGITWKDGEVLHIKRQMYLDFPAKTKFVAFYVPAPDPLSATKTAGACLRLVEAVQQTLDDIPKKVAVSGGYRGEMNSIQDLTFSGRVLIYHDAFLSITQKAEIIHVYTARHFDVQFRGPEYLGDQVVAWHRKNDPPPKQQ